MAKEILGHVDCPHCGHEKGMRITLDKSGAPFGYCEANCNGQMRVGGNAARVKAFYSRHPHLKKPEEEGAAPVSVPVTPEAKKPPKVLSILEQLSGAK